MAAYCDRREEEGLAWKDVFKLLILAGIPIGLVLIQPDLGTAIIMMIVLLVMLAVAGLPIRILVILLIGVALVAVVAFESGILHSYQIARLTTFLNPNSTSTNPERDIRHLQHDPGQERHRLRLASSGPGLLHGAQTNLGYVPEQSDRLHLHRRGRAAGLCRRGGPAGPPRGDGLAAAAAAGRSRDVFGRLVCTGLFTFVAFSVFQNAGMTMGIMPITGIPLPFVSYGGTAVICLLPGRGPGAQRGCPAADAMSGVQPEGAVQPMPPHSG